MASATAQRVREIAKGVNRSVRTVWRWANLGCDLDDPESIRQFAGWAEARKTNIQKARERRAVLNGTNVSGVSGAHGPGRSARPDLCPPLSGGLPPPSPKRAGGNLHT